jgi:hypothetical protein
MILEPGLVLIGLSYPLDCGWLLQLLTSFLCGVDGCTDGVDLGGVDCCGGLFLQVETCPKVNKGNINNTNNIFFIARCLI